MARRTGRFPQLADSRSGLNCGVSPLFLLLRRTADSANTVPAEGDGHIGQVVYDATLIGSCAADQNAQAPLTAEAIAPLNTKLGVVEKALENLELAEQQMKRLRPRQPWPRAKRLDTRPWHLSAPRRTSSSRA
jgi:hypothetical protein